MKHVKGFIFALTLVLALVGTGSRGRAEGKLAQGEEGSLPPLVNLSPEEETQVKERMAKAFGISTQAAGKILKDYNQKQDLGAIERKAEEGKWRFHLYGGMVVIAMAGLIFLLAREDDGIQYAMFLLFFALCFCFFVIFGNPTFGESAQSVREDQEQREMAIQYLLEEEHPQVDALGLSHLSKFVRSYY